MNSTPSNSQQNQPSREPEETTPELKPWSTPLLQRLNGKATETMKEPGDGELFLEQPS